MSDQHSLAVIEGIDDYCARIAKSNLKDGLLIFAPPLFADGGMVVA
jgi:hypothetical protein